jgi:hypothetical protein
MIDQDRVMSQTSKNRVEQWLEHLGTPALPVPGFEIEAGRTALVITDPQNDFLHSDGIAWGACGEGVTENGIIANFGAMLMTSMYAIGTWQTLT